MPEGTSERKAIGSETMNASSELARTSFAAPPIAAPKAAKAAPPARIASRIIGVRAQSIETSAVSAASSRSVTANEATTPSATFSARSPAGPTSPRVILAKAFSSRSSANDPATSSTVTNIRVTVAATAIAKSSSSEVLPATTCLSIAIGSAIAPSNGSARSRFSPARPANSITWSSASRAGLSGGSSASTVSRIVAARLRPRMSTEPRSGRLNSPPSTSRSR